ncbi:MAG: hypothetical protein IKK52_06470 [Alphaproteobacteria bacterium]|nr:hypothetical protein [Alphaproteobacteria bacterium]
METEVIEKLLKSVAVQCGIWFGRGAISLFRKISLWFCNLCIISVR